MEKSTSLKLINALLAMGLLLTGFIAGWAWANEIATKNAYAFFENRTIECKTFMKKYDNQQYDSPKIMYAPQFNYSINGDVK